MSDEKSKKIDWVQIIIGLVFVGLSVFGFSSYMKFKKEEQRRVDAQNELARNSKIIQENSNTWSRLAQQKDDAINDLRADNERLAKIVEERGEEIYALSSAIVKFKSIKFIIKEGDANQSEETPGRLRVDFKQVQDPVSVSGYTLTNPAHAELEVGFTRPLKLKTVTTQRPDGSWNTYVSGDWPNLEIEQIESVVNPLLKEKKSLGDRLIFGVGVGPTVSFDGLMFQTHVLYDFDVLSIGPFLATGADTGGVIGIMAQTRPFSNW